MTNTLKPCPFCGGEAYAVDVLEKRAHAVCDTCHASTAYYFSEVEAIEAWNTRAERTCRITEDETGYPVCSECGAIQPDDYTVYYCWSCGAKVIGD